MSDYEYLLQRTATQKIDERIEQTRRSRIPDQRKRSIWQWPIRHRGV